MTLDYVKARNRSGKTVHSGDRAIRGRRFSFEKVYDVTKLEPVVAKPHSPDNRA